MKMENVGKGIFALIMAGATYLWGGWDGILTALIAVIVLDYITGLLKAAHEGKLNSAVGAKGIIKKFMYMAVVALAHILDGVISTNGLLRNVCIYFFIANEGLSVIENAAVCGFPIPQKLRDALEQLRGKE